MKPFKYVFIGAFLTTLVPVYLVINRSVAEQLIMAWYSGAVGALALFCALIAYTLDSEEPEK